MTEIDGSGVEVISPVEFFRRKAERDFPEAEPELAIIANTDPTKLTQGVERTWKSWKDTKKRSFDAEINYGDTVAKKSTTSTSPELFEAARRSTDAKNTKDALQPSALLAAQIDVRRNRLTRFMRYSAVVSSTVVFGLGASTYNYHNQTQRINSANEAEPQEVDHGQVLSVGLAGAGAGSIVGFLAGGAFHEKHARRKARKIIAKTNKTAGQTI